MSHWPEHIPMVDLYAPPSPGSLMRTVSIEDIGIFRLARRDAELYSVQILSAGTWGRLDVWSLGEKRKLFPMQSMFPGSFWLSAGAIGGIVVGLFSYGAAPLVNVNWREKDTKIV